MTHSTTALALDINDAALLLALLERETAMGPIDDSADEREYGERVRTLTARLTAITV